MRTTLRRLSLSLALATPALMGGGDSLALCVLNETAAPGGVAQLKLANTDPKPITSGDLAFAVDSAVFADVLGVSVFSAGDASGLAVYDASRLRIRFASPLSSVGLAKDYPFLVAALAVRPDVARGTDINLKIDLPASSFLGPLGQIYKEVPVKEGELLVTGSVSIRDVLPGGGMVPAGAPIIIDGIGFQAGAAVKIGYAVVTPITVTPNRIEVSAPVPLPLDGTLVQVVNPDGSSDTYYSYHRGQLVGRSSNLLIAPAAPIFSNAALAQGSFGPMPAGGADYDSLAGLALQNPGSSPAVVTVAVQSGGSVIAQGSLVLAPGARIVREITEYVGAFSPVAGATITVSSSQPLQMLGIAGDAITRSLIPFQPAP